MSINFSALPSVNAALNGASAVLLTTGFYFIRAKNIPAHRFCMVSAFCVSILFLISYIVYHAHAGTTHFKGTGVVRPVYFSILATHTILAALTPFLAIATLARAFRRDFERHKKMARITLPVWLYVSVTGVVIYVMLYVVKYS